MILQQKEMQSDPDSSSTLTALLVAKRHTLKFLVQLLPIVRLKFGILHPLLCPILIPPADMVLGMLEITKLVSDTFFDEDSSSMLGYDGLFVLQAVSYGL